MKTFSGARGIEYNEELINEETITLWTSLTVPESLKQVEPEDVVWLSDIVNSTEFQNNDVSAFYDDSATKAAVTEAIDYIKSDPEYNQIILSASQSDDRLFKDIYEDLKTALLSPTVDERVTNTNFRILDRIKLSTDEAGIFECQLDGEILLKADTNTLAGMNVKVIFQVAIVFLDIVTIIMAAAGILAETGKEFAKRFVTVAGKIESWFMEMMESFWAKVKYLIDEVRVLFKTSGESAKWFKAVKDAAIDVAKAIAAVISWARNAKKFDELKSACKSAIGLMFSSGWQKVKAACQLIASLILLCVSGGTSLILKIVTLVAGLVSLILDSIDLYDMTHANA